MNKEIYLLHTANQWIEHDSMRLVAAFTNIENIILYLENTLNSEDLQELESNMQTQGKETNYVILTEKLNPEP